MTPGQQRKLRNMVNNYRSKGWPLERITRIVRSVARKYRNSPPISEAEINQFLIGCGLPVDVRDLEG